MAVVLGGCEETQEETREEILFGTANIPADREQYRELMREACAEEGIPEYENLLMAIMAVESSGSNVEDVMQSSESLGLPPNSLGIADSIRQGARYFKVLLDKAAQLGADINAVIQAYNFGSGFLDYAAKECGGQYTEALAVAFSDLMKETYQTKVYGNPYYLSAVLQYFSFVEESEEDTVSEEDSAREEDDGSENDVQEEDTISQEDIAFQRLMEVALRYEGVPYVFGGDSPMGFDCSGFTQYVYAQIGISLPRTAQTQYNASRRITENEARPGDLIFFTKTYKTSVMITHVAIYVGDGLMYQAGGNCVGYANSNTAYWREHFAGFGRVW